jgi:hypothetical protein
MKLQKITRMHGMLMILGAVLLLANITRAQQEVDPTTFDTTSGDASTKQSAGAKTARHSEATDEMKAKAAAPVAAQSDNRGAQEERVTQLSVPDIAALLVLIIGTGMSVLYALRHRGFGGPGKTVRRT